MPIWFIAHAGHHHLEASEVMRWWSFEPVVTATIVITVALYTIGLVRSHGIRRWQALSFYGGCASLIAALISPLDALGGILFSAHMAQHEVLMVIAAPLLVLGRPLIAFMWALPLPWRKFVGRWASGRTVQSVWVFVSLPVVAWILHAAAI